MNLVFEKDKPVDFLTIFNINHQNFKYISNGLFWQVVMENRQSLSFVIKGLFLSHIFSRWSSSYIAEIS